MPIPDTQDGTAPAKFAAVKWGWSCSICDTYNTEDEDIASGEVVSCSRCNAGHFVERGGEDDRQPQSRKKIRLQYCNER